MPAVPAVWEDAGSHRHTAAATATPAQYGMNASRHPSMAASAPPIGGSATIAAASAAELRPIRRVRSAPSQASAIVATTRLINPAAPAPWTSRAATSSVNDGASAPSPPPMPNASRHPVSTTRRPYRSASAPVSGVSRIPGTVAAASTGPASGTPNSAATSGSTAGTSV